MNNERRKLLNDVKQKLEDIAQELEDIKSMEDEALNNLPESLQEGEKGEKMNAAIDAIDEAQGYVNDAISSIETATE